jgi:hypothetical protein
LKLAENPVGGWGLRREIGITTLHSSSLSGWEYFIGSAGNAFGSGGSSDSDFTENMTTAAILYRETNDRKILGNIGNRDLLFTRISPVVNLAASLPSLLLPPFGSFS